MNVDISNSIYFKWKTYWCWKYVTCLYTISYSNSNKCVLNFGVKWSFNLENPVSTDRSASNVAKIFRRAAGKAVNGPWDDFLRCDDAVFHANRIGQTEICPFRLIFSPSFVFTTNQIERHYTNSEIDWQIGPDDDAKWAKRSLVNPISAYRYANFNRCCIESKLGQQPVFLYSIKCGKFWKNINKSRLKQNQCSAFNIIPICIIYNMKVCRNQSNQSN